MLTKKVMILFEPDKYKKLEEQAFIQKKSVGSLVREAVEKIVLKEETSKEKKIKAAMQLISAEEDIPEWDEIERKLSKIRQRKNK